MMDSLLDDPVNVNLLKLLCEGVGVNVNHSELSEKLHRHRNTVASRLMGIFQHKIVEEPFHPFPWLMKEHPLLVIEKVNLPRDDKTNTWIELDPAIWAAFFVRDEEYNTLMFELHRDLYAYQEWKDRIVEEEMISLPIGHDYYQSEPIYLSTKAIIKDDSTAPMAVLKEDFENQRHTGVSGLELDSLSVDLLTSLVRGDAIRSNPNELATKLDIHRRTVQRRMENLERAGVISRPVCRFPRIWAPPDYFMVLSLLQVEKHKGRVLKAYVEDPHVSLLVKASANRYNVLMCSSFYRMGDHLSWEEQYDQRFPGSLRAVKNLYLSPAMTFSIHQQFVSLAYLDQRLKEIRGKEILTKMQQTRRRSPQRRRVSKRVHTVRGGSDE